MSERETSCKRVANEITHPTTAEFCWALLQSDPRCLDKLYLSSEGVLSEGGSGTRLLALEIAKAAPTALPRSVWETDREIFLESIKAGVPLDPGSAWCADESLMREVIALAPLNYVFMPLPMRNRLEFAEAATKAMPPLLFFVAVDNLFSHLQC